MTKLFKFNPARDKRSTFKSVCCIHVQRQPGLAASSEDTGRTNKRRSKWISRLCRPGTRCLRPISRFACRETEDMKISESTQPAALTWWTLFFVCVPLATASTLVEEKKQQQTTTQNTQKNTKNTKPDHYSQWLFLKTTCNTWGCIPDWPRISDPLCDLG